MVAIVTGVDFLENLLAFFCGDAMLERASDAAFVKFSIDQGICLRSMHDALGFLLVLGEVTS